MDPSEKAKKKFELICRHKDAGSSNVNMVFANYGCGMLEAKIPIVDDRVAEQIKNSSLEDQKYETLVAKNGSASLAVEGRHARTRDRRLALVEIGKDVVISAGKLRERSPVDRVELDDELGEYMRKTAELRAKKREARRVREETAIQPDVKMLHDRDTPEDWDM